MADLLVHDDSMKTLDTRLRITFGFDFSQNENSYDKSRCKCPRIDFEFESKLSLYHVFSVSQKPSFLFINFIDGSRL